ncbi:MAG: site-specific integrase [Sedimenticolaceae bacterium]
MDQFHPDIARDRPLDKLVAGGLVQLEKLGYSRRSLRRYHAIWRHLTAFAQQEGLGDTFSEDLAVRFVEAYRLRADETIEPSEGWRRHVVYGIRVLAAFARDGHVERCRTDMQKVQIPPAMKKPLRDYEVYGRDRLYLRPSSLSLRIRELAIFLDFLGSRNLETLDQLQPADLTAFVMWRPRLRPKTISRILSDVRSFLKFLSLKGILQRDLSVVLPTIRVPRDATIPSVWDPELLARLLRAVDRSSPKGKRDYAILLLACRLGLRLGDIRALRLENLNWEAATIDIIQSKTGAPLQLPLTEEVGEALIDYLRAGRPQTDRREVFLKLNPPFAPFSENNHLHQIVTHWRKLAGIEFRSKRRRGLHSLRHTLATELLRAETPFHIISEILGHATTASTLIYAKADVEALRSVALDTEELAHGE